MKQVRNARFAEKRRKEKAKEAALWAWHDAGRPRARCPVKVTLIVRRQRVMDDDNVYRGLKHVRDALFNGAITKSDSPKFFGYAGIRFETGKHWKGHEEVVFIVEARDQLPMERGEREL